jgi:hypothetical protein
MPSSCSPPAPSKLLGCCAQGSGEAAAPLRYSCCISCELLPPPMPYMLFCWLSDCRAAGSNPPYLCQIVCWSQGCTMLGICHVVKRTFTKSACRCSSPGCPCQAAGPRKAEVWIATTHATATTATTQSTAAQPECLRDGSIGAEAVRQSQAGCCEILRHTTRQVGLPAGIEPASGHALLLLLTLLLLLHLCLVLQQRCPLLLLLLELLALLLLLLPRMLLLLLAGLCSAISRHDRPASRSTFDTLVFVHA